MIAHPAAIELARHTFTGALLTWLQKFA
jgi:hypothetical protein